MPFSGVFAAKDGKVTLVSKDLTGPNGLAFSPDEKFFYVDNWDDQKKIVMRYEVNPDGTLKNGKLFFDMTSAGTEDALDGMKIDKAGNLYVSGPRRSLDSLTGRQTSRDNHSRRNILTISLGAMPMGKLSTSARGAGFIGCD